MQKLKNFWAVSLLFLASGAAAYDLQNDSSNAENFQVGSCTFRAKAEYYLFDNGSDFFAYGEIELQSNLPGVGYRYVGPKFNARSNYDEYFCDEYGGMCDENHSLGNTDTTAAYGRQY